MIQYYLPASQHDIRRPEQLQSSVENTHSACLRDETVHKKKNRRWRNVMMNYRFKSTIFWQVGTASIFQISNNTYLAQTISEHRWTSMMMISGDMMNFVLPCHIVGRVVCAAEWLLDPAGLIGGRGHFFSRPDRLVLSLEAARLWWRKHPSSSPSCVAANRYQGPNCRLQGEKWKGGRDARRYTDIRIYLSALSVENKTLECCSLLYHDSLDPIRDYYLILLNYSPFCQHQNTSWCYKTPRFVCQ